MAEARCSLRKQDITKWVLSEAVKLISTSVCQCQNAASHWRLNHNGAHLQRLEFHFESIGIFGFALPQYTGWITQLEHHSADILCVKPQLKWSSLVLGRRNSLSIQHYKIIWNECDNTVHRRNHTMISDVSCMWKHTLWV